MEADRQHLSRPVEGCRKDVLTGVLLHMLEPSRPIDRAPRRAELDWALDQVQNPAVVAIDHVDDASGTEDAGIERLATGGRIESGPIENDCEMARTLRHCVDADNRASNSRA